MILLRKHEIVNSNKYMVLDFSTPGYILSHKIQNDFVNSNFDSSTPIVQETMKLATLPPGMEESKVEMF